MYMPCTNGLLLYFSLQVCALLQALVIRCSLHHLSYLWTVSVCTSSQQLVLKSICVEINHGSYVVDYGFIILCGGQVCLGLLHGKC